MKILHFFILASALLFVFSCSNESDSTSERYLPPSSGTHAELLVVTKDSIWRGPSGEAILNVFAKEQYGLPQPEGIFSVNKVDPSGFQGLLKKAKSIVFIELGDSVFIESKVNVWASPQIVTTIVARNTKELLALLKANEMQLTNIYHESDLDVVRGRMEGHIYKTLPKELAGFGIKKMYLQEGFSLVIDKPELKVYRQDTKKTTQYLLFSVRPIREGDLPGQDIIATRDSIGKYNFEGTADNSYFGTEKILPPQQENTEVDGRFAIETRGLWKTYNDFMGGPFVSYTIYNDERNEILTVEGFLYGPDAKKRNILLEMEAMMTSIEFAD